MNLIQTRRFAPSPELAAVRDRFLAAALNSLDVQIAVLDEDGIIVAVNDAWVRFAAENGAADHPSVIEGAHYLAAYDEVDDAKAVAALAGVRDVIDGTRDEFVLEYPCHSPDEIRWFELRATPLRDEGRRGAVVAHSVITQRKLAELRLEFLASHDELTGLSNRRRVIEVLESMQPSGRLGVLLVDLDHFKLVNDTHGHAAGNDVLCAVSRALEIQLPGGSLAGRHGGDEFCVLHFDADPARLRHAAEALCDETRRRLAELSVAGGVTVSVGATVARPDESVADAMRRADQALYTVKRAGRAGFRVV